MSRIITATALALALCPPAHAGDQLRDSIARAAADMVELGKTPLPPPPPSAEDLARARVLEADSKPL